MARNICLHYIVGVSLGAGRQPTGLAVIEQETRGSGTWRAENSALRLRHLERLGLGTSRPAVVERVGEIIDKAREAEQAKPSDVILDVTGTGRAAIGLFQDAQLAPFTVTITNGSGETESDKAANDWRISKSLLVGNLQVLFEASRLLIAESLPLAPVFCEDLQKFKLRDSAILGNDPEAWREGANDDLVFAVSLAIWRAERHIPLPQYEQDKMDRKIAEHFKKYAVV